MYQLHGKVALVTGAGGERGIGRAIAQRLATEGADVAVNDLTIRPHGSTESAWQGLTSVTREIEELGRRATAILGDVSDADQADHLIRTTVERLGRLDILINNAGALAGADRRPVVELDEAEWDRIQRVNVKGTFLCSRAAAQHLIRAKHPGKIINLSSIAGKKGVARYAAYCASKFAVIGFTQSLALELAANRINVNAICPALVETERVDHMAAALKPNNVATNAFRATMINDSTQETALGRIAQPDDVANMAAFLASSQSDYLTGLAINVAGGALMD